MSAPREAAGPLHANLEAEAAVLGSIALAADMLPEVLQILKPEDFYSPAHRTVFEAMIHLARTGTPIDSITLYDELHRGGNLDRVGGPECIARIMVAVPTPSNAVHYAKAVHEQSTARTGAALADRLKDELGRLNGSTAWSTIADIARDLGKLSEPHTAGAADVTDLLSHPPTEPISLLDTRGLLDEGELHIIAGPPGSGKSLLAVNLAVSIAAGSSFWHLRELDRYDPLPVLILLAEYNRFRAFQRLCNVVTTAGVRPGFLRILTREDSPRIDLADGGASAARMCSLVRQYGIRLVEIDSLSEISSADENDRSAMMRVVDSLRRIADQGCAVLLIHHNRKPPAGAKGKGDASLADMRGTGAISAALASQIQCMKEEGEGPSRSFIAHWKKHNYADPAFPVFRFTLDEPGSGVISDMETCSGVGRKPAANDDEVLRIVAEAGGKDVSTSAIASRLGVSVKTAREYLSGLVARMKLPPPSTGARSAQLWSLH